MNDSHLKILKKELGKKSVAKGGILDCGLVYTPGHPFYHLLASFY